MNKPLQQQRGRRRIALTAIALSALLAGTWFIVALVTFVLPTQQPLRDADAIVSLSPPTERLPVALDAWNEGLAPRLWLSYVPSDIMPGDEERRIDELCDGAEGREVACFPPATYDTIGEARAVADLVEASGVDSVIVVTNVSHSARARYLFEACLPPATDVQLLLVVEPNSPLFRFERMVYETGAFAKALVEARQCDD